MYHKAHRARGCVSCIPPDFVLPWLWWQWGAATSEERGPILGTNTNEGHRNIIGAHSGSYSIYRALAVASGTLDPVRSRAFRSWAGLAHASSLCQCCRPLADRAA